MIRICARNEITAGEGMRVDSISPPIAIFRTEDDEFFAVDDTCTHQDASLADGWLEGCEIECPLHASKFNLRTGMVDAPPAKLPIRVHEVTLSETDVYVTLSADAPNLPPGISAVAS